MYGWVDVLAPGVGKLRVVVIQVVIPTYTCFESKEHLQIHRCFGARSPTLESSVCNRRLFSSFTSALLPISIA